MKIDILDYFSITGVIIYNLYTLLYSNKFDVLRLYIYKMFSNKSQKHQWSSGRIVPCHGTDPGSIPGWCTFLRAVMIKAFE